MASSREGAPPGPAAVAGARKRRRVCERRILWLSLLLAAPGLIVALVLIRQQNWPTDVKWSLAAALVLACLFIQVVLHDHVIRLLQSTTNVMSSLRGETVS